MSNPMELILGDPNPLMLQALAEIFDRDRRFSLIASSKTAEGSWRRAAGACAFGVIDWSLPQQGRAPAGNFARQAQAAAHRDLRILQRSRYSTPGHGSGGSGILHARHST
jgi:two-component system nitrate/nitrite response regulator NarP